MSIAHPAADLDAPAPCNLVQIERALALDHAEMDRILGCRRQLFEMGARQLDEVGLVLRKEAELEQFGPQSVPDARNEREITALDQRTRQPSRGASSISGIGPSATASSTSNPRSSV
jgi:hypothetical protein